mgnify:CR=1 FL=1
MEKGLKERIKKYVDDWHWDENSEKYAYDIGKFLFSFMDYLADQNLSEKTKRNHRNNVYCIGMFEARYGYNDKFYPKNLEDGPSFIYEFKRKVNNSKYAIQSYKSTWRKLDKYIKSEDYKKYLNKIEKKINTVSNN